MRGLVLSLLFLLLLNGEKSFSQMTTADSSFLNSMFVESTFISYWNKPGTWFTNNEVSSITNLYEQIQENYKFSGSDFIHCYPKIQLTGDMEYLEDLNTTWNDFEQNNNIVLYGIQKPFVRFPFRLNGIDEFAYAVLDSTTNPTNCKNAFVMIPGTGVNQMTDVIKGLGYHNINCYLSNYLKQMGDVYNTGMANEDHRAIFFNKKKLGSLAPSQPTFLQSYLNSIGRPLGINRLIEIVALIKHLKQKYDKVFVAGLSTGGKVALWASMEAEPHATLVASGYSILVDNHAPTQLINTYAYGNYLTLYTKDSTKSRLSQLKTQFLITQAMGDNALATLEVDSNITQKYFEGLTNTSYFYNYFSHAFPPCFVTDSFFSRSINMASCKVSMDTFSCKQDSAKLAVSFCGQGPFTYSIFKDNQWLQTFYNRPASDTITLFASGLYQIDSIKDALNRPGFRSDTIRYMPHVPISFSVSQSNFNCTAAQAEFQFNANAAWPGRLYYKKNGIDDSLTLLQSSSTWLPDNGIYYLNKFIDTNNCILQLDDTLVISYDTLSVSLSNPVYDCDSNKTKLHFELSGNGPWVIDYTYNGLAQQLTTSSSSLDAYFVNGLYQFLQVRDATQCESMINAAYTFNYNPIDVSVISSKYDCDSNLFHVELKLKGNSPWVITYTDGATTSQKIFYDSIASLFLNNGQWELQTVSDITGCQLLLGLQYAVNFNPISASLSTPLYNCDSNKVQLNVQLAGNSPWKLYTKNIATNVQTIHTIYGNSDSLFFGNGLYQIIHVSDSTDCLFALLQPLVNNYSPLSYQKNSLTYDCDSNKVKLACEYQGDGPWNLEVLDLINNSTTYYSSNLNYNDLYFSTGSYLIRKLTDQKCEVQINDTLHVNFPALSAFITPKTISCIDEKYKIGLNVNSGLFPLKLEYVYNGLNDSHLISQPTTDLLLPNGNYFFTKLIDSVGCEVDLNKLVVADYNPINFKSIEAHYDCLKDSTKIDLEFEGEDSIRLVYSKVGSTLDSLNLQSHDLYVTNGEYRFHLIRDQLGCVDSVNQDLVINRQALTFSIDTIYPNCNEQRHEMQASLIGNFPIRLWYNYKNKSELFYITQTNNTILLDNGEYYLTKLQDSTECVLSLDTNLNLPVISFVTPVLSTDYKNIMVSPSGLMHRWYYNNVLVDSLSKNNLKILGEGDYMLVLVDSAGCEYQSNALIIEFPSEINVYPNPVHNEMNVLVNDKFKKLWSYTIHTANGKLVSSGLSETPQKNIDVSTLAAGDYSITISYTNSDRTVKSVVRFLKIK